MSEPHDSSTKERCIARCILLSHRFIPYVIPIYLLAVEKKYIGEGKNDTDKASIKRTARMVMVHKWQEQRSQESKAMCH